MNKIEVGDYILCNVGEGNELIYVNSLSSSSLTGVRFCSPNSGTGPFPIWTDPTERTYPLEKCSLYCKQIKKELIMEIFL